MPEFRNRGETGSHASVSDDVIEKAGRAVGKIAQIRESFHQRVAAAGSEDERQQLSQRADRAAVAVIREEGLSVEEYNRVLTAADEDADVEERMLAAAQESE